MSTYFNGNSEIQQGSASAAAAADHGSLQTLILMNPPTPYHNLSHLAPQQQLPHHHFHQQQQQQTNNNNNLVFLNQQHHQHQLVGIPLQADHGFMPRVHYGMYGEPARAQQQGSLSLSLSAQNISPARGGAQGEDSSPGSGVSNCGVRGSVGVLSSSKYLKAAQELLDEVVSVGKGAKVESRGSGKAAIESATSVGDGEAGGKRGGGGELSTAERQEVQMRKAKLVGMLDEVEQRYRQYHHQMQVVISWFEQATGIGSAKTYTALALQTISKQFRCLKDAISSQIRASSKSLGEEDSFGGGSKNEGSRLKYVDHQIRQQRALQQLGMIQPNAWRPQRGLPERSVSVLRAWLFEHFLHPYPKDSDKIMLAKQTGLTRSQVSNWFINARVRLWKPMVEEMYMEEIKEQEHNGSDEKNTKNENNGESTSKIITQQEKTPVVENQNMNFKSIVEMPPNQNSPPVISASPSPTGLNIRNQPGFTLIRSPEMESIAQASPKKQRNVDMLQSPNNNYLTNEHIATKFDSERQNRDNFALMGAPTNFIGGFGAYPIGEIGRFSAEQFPATYSGNGVSLTLGLPHCENLSLSGAHQSFLQNQNMQMERRLEIGDPDEFAAMNTSTPNHSSAAYESINIQNRKRFAAQLLPDFVT